MKARPSTPSSVELDRFPSQERSSTLSNPLAQSRSRKVHRLFYEAYECEADSIWRKSETLPFVLFTSSHSSLHYAMSVRPPSPKYEEGIHLPETLLQYRHTLDQGASHGRQLRLSELDIAMSVTHVVVKVCHPVPTSSLYKS